MISPSSHEENVPSVSDQTEEIAETEPKTLFETIRETLSEKVHQLVSTGTEHEPEVSSTTDVSQVSTVYQVCKSLNHLFQRSHLEKKFYTRASSNLRIPISISRKSRVKTSFRPIPTSSSRPRMRQNQQ